MHDLGNRLVSPPDGESLRGDGTGDDPMAEYLLDKITDLACYRVRKFAEAGADILLLGDDIGMQSTPMMSMAMYRTWLKPRLAKVIAAAKSVKPDLLVHYHSCGYVLPFIDDLIEAGVDILNPVQPECMDFAQIHAQVRRPAFVQRHPRHAATHAVRHAGASAGGGAPQSRRSPAKRAVCSAAPPTCSNRKCPGRISRPMSRRSREFKCNFAGRIS